MDDTQLEKLTVNELRELNGQIESAIRAAIRAKRLGGMPAMSVGGGVAAAPVMIDLERECDAWLSAKR